ncbi:MAG: hypothetical protein IJD37_01845 [Clostridia bacterium]|nr:hypothetical protein [Clostridia bacterium]
MIRKIIRTGLTILFATSLLISCGKNNAEIPDKTESLDNEKEEQKANYISGKVISIAKNSSGLAEFKILTDNGSVCKVSPGVVSESAVQLGQEVLVTVEGSVMETDPMQAVAKSVDVTEEFNELPLNTEIYSVYGISSSKVSEALTSTGFRFYRLSNYDQCLEFLETNDLYEDFQSAVGNTDIAQLTNSFFEENDLTLFVVNSAENEGNQIKGIYQNDSEIYLSINQITKNAVLANTKFDVFLLPISKESNAEVGYVLIEKTLYPALSEE